MPFVNEKSNVTGASRTIDYERDAILKQGGGIGPMPGSEFCLTWKGFPIEFSATDDLNMEKRTIVWDIYGCSYPEELRPLRRQIRALILEAMDVFGVDYGKDEGTEVIVKIRDRIGNLNPNFNFETKQFEDHPVADGTQQ